MLWKKTKKKQTLENIKFWPYIRTCLRSFFRLFKKLNHGEAVILGMQSALRFSLKNNLIQRQDYHSILKHVSNANLPSKINKYFKIKDLNKILSFMTKDKKIIQIKLV